MTVKPKVGHLIGVTGVPGDGKSFFARSARDVGKTAVALTDPKEAAFYGADATLIWDAEWRPHKGAGEGNKATGWLELLRWTEARQADDSEFVVVDTGTEATRLAEHEYFKLQNVFAPGDLEYGRGYTGPEQLIYGLITEWRRLVVAGKTVIVTFHAGMKELEGSGTPRNVKDMAGNDVQRFDEKLLPIVAGRNVMAQAVGSAFDLWLYTLTTGYDATVDPKLPEKAQATVREKGAKREFWLTAVPDAVRPAKHSARFKEGVNLTRIPNTVRALWERLER